jgi:hypothetical protein
MMAADRSLAGHPHPYQRQLHLLLWINENTEGGSYSLAGLAL